MRTATTATREFSPVPSSLTRNSPLFSKVCEFNLLPARDIHPGHLTGWITPDLFRRLAECPRGSAHLSRLVLARFLRSRQPWFDFEDPRRRLALLPGDTLRSLRDHVSAALCTDEFRKILDRRTRMRLTDRLGKPLLEFAEKRAPFLIGQSLLQGNELDPSIRDILDRFDLRGRMCLASWFSTQPGPLIDRIRLKFSPSDNPRTWPQIDAATATRYWDVTQRIGKTQFGPVWGVVTM